MKQFEKYCEEIFQQWYSNSLGVEGGQTFDLEYCPEPYFTIEEGDKPLYVLNTNPGNGQGFQKREHIANHLEEPITYKKVIAYFSKYYLENKFYSKAFKRNFIQANSRNKRILAFAEQFGYNGVVAVETIPFHSKYFPNKINILNNTYLKPIYSKYYKTLKNALRDKPVLIIGAIRSDVSISANTVFDNEWRNFQMQIANMQIRDGRILEASYKDDGKVSSAIIINANKYLSVQMGNNNLPSARNIARAKEYGAKPLHIIDENITIGSYVKIIEIPLYGLLGRVVGEDSDGMMTVKLGRYEGITVNINKRNLTKIRKIED